MTTWRSGSTVASERPVSGLLIGRTIPHGARPKGAAPCSSRRCSVSTIVRTHLRALARRCIVRRQRTALAGEVDKEVRRWPNSSSSVIRTKRPPSGRSTRRSGIGENLRGRPDDEDRGSRCQAAAFGWHGSHARDRHARRRTDGIRRRSSAVGLGTAEPFAVLAGTAVTNTGPTTITGDLGIHPAAAVTGFPPGTVNGTTHAADAVAVQAQSDLATAYLDAAGRPATATHATLGGQISSSAASTTPAAPRSISQGRSRSTARTTRIPSGSSRRRPTSSRHRPVR